MLTTTFDIGDIVELIPGVRDDLAQFYTGSLTVVYGGADRDPIVFRVGEYELSSGQFLSAIPRIFRPVVFLEQDYEYI